MKITSTNLPLLVVVMTFCLLATFYYSRHAMTIKMTNITEIISGTESHVNTDHNQAYHINKDDNNILKSSKPGNTLSSTRTLKDQTVQQSVHLQSDEYSLDRDDTTVYDDDNMVLNDASYEDSSADDLDTTSDSMANNNSLQDACLPCKSVHIQGMIAGVKKGGTATVTSMLNRGSPHLCVSQHPYFIYENGNRTELERKTYEKCDKDLSKVILHRETGCFSNKKCAERIYNYDKHMKLIFLIREPVERLVSEYLQYFAVRLKYNEKNPNAKLPCPNVYQWLKNNRTAAGAIATSRYVEHFRRWLKLFPIEQIHLVDSKELTNTPWAAFKKIETFLNVPYFYTEDRFVAHKQKFRNGTFYCLKPIVGRLKCMGGTKGRTHPKLNSNTVKALHNYFRPYNEAFFKLVNQKFDWP